MKPEEIHMSDISRILLGEVPGIFLIEVFIRIFFIFFLLWLSMRLMGKRMSSMMSIQELATLVTLAAAVGIPMQNPDRGILPALLITILITLFQRQLSLWSFKNKRIEKMAIGKGLILIEDGRLHLQNMKKVRVTRERIFGQLRSKGIKHLGTVRRLYIEAEGSFSIIQRQKKIMPGLSILLTSDLDFIAKQKKAENSLACNFCGNIAMNQQGEEQSKCHNCHHHEWVAASL
jgi:uncharacterized membrane protein YcaP (DUF421 family)